MARFAMRRTNARLDALFAAADSNKDGKLTKEEFANFVWKRFAKPDAQSVTKDEVKNFIKQRMSSLRAERPTHRRHKATGAAPKKEEPKSGTKPAPAATPKAEPKAEAKPVALPAATAAQPAPESKPTAPASPAVSKTSPASSTNKSVGVFNAEAGPPALPRHYGPKIGTSTTSGDVKAALFAARR